MRVPTWRSSTVRRRPSSPHGSGRGLIGLAERVAIFGGRLDVGPTSDGGWRLAATLPVTR